MKPFDISTATIGSLSAVPPDGTYVVKYASAEVKEKESDTGKTVFMALSLAIVSAQKLAKPEDTAPEVGFVFEDLLTLSGGVAMGRNNTYAKLSPIANANNIALGAEGSLGKVLTVIQSTPFRVLVTTNTDAKGIARTNYSWQALESVPSAPVANNLPASNTAAPASGTFQ